MVRLQAEPRPHPIGLGGPSEVAQRIIAFQFPAIVIFQQAVIVISPAIMPQALHVVFQPEPRNIHVNVRVTVFRLGRIHCINIIIVVSIVIYADFVVVAGNKLPFEIEQATRIVDNIIFASFQFNAVQPDLLRPGHHRKVVTPRANGIAFSLTAHPIERHRVTFHLVGTHGAAHLGIPRPRTNHCTERRTFEPEQTHRFVVPGKIT